ncbi:hypothetical protein CBR_g34942 [Chara braunii]|uniref:O-fucosyltransferase family protein n=1 Tax=Chara braunii TaxID=69332 RepID=A0A388LJR9_CHABU|nr:hypothetical protein CBR_g34942 [Chara braunii]|eukprot:GBG82566.1 hypothetical protein CBR_g34942 [Chara braunii]
MKSPLVWCVGLFVVIFILLLQAFFLIWFQDKKLLSKVNYFEQLSSSSGGVPTESPLPRLGGLSSKYTEHVRELLEQGTAWLRNIPAESAQYHKEDLLALKNEIAQIRGLIDLVDEHISLELQWSSGSSPNLSEPRAGAELQCLQWGLPRNNVAQRGPDSQNHSKDSQRKIPPSIGPLHCPALGPQKRWLAWSPREDRYLVMMCMAKGVQKRTECLFNHMIASALLNRTLVIPLTDEEFDYRLHFDFNHIADCFGAQVVVSLDTFLDTAAADASLPNASSFGWRRCLPSHRNKESVELFKARTGLSFARDECNQNLVGSPSSTTDVNLAEFVAQYSSEERVIAIGEGYGLRMGNVTVDLLQGKDPWVVNCSTPVVIPQAAIVRTASLFIKTFLGPKFIGVRFHRDDYWNGCRRQNASHPCSIHSVPQVARFLSQLSQATGTNVMFMSTDWADGESTLLHDLLNIPGWPIMLGRLPDRLGVNRTSEYWARWLLRMHINSTDVMHHTLHQAVLALSTTFVYTPSTLWTDGQPRNASDTFIDEVLRLRTAWKTTGCFDGPICGAEQPDQLDLIPIS